MSSPVIIDPAAISALRALNPGDNDEFLREIVGIFFSDMPKRIALLDQNLATGDNSKFSRAAHSIRGSAGNLGAVALRDVAALLERRSFKEGLANCAGPLA
jgi:HPt (histidine-containing phosphotransfer) domain-containing protein